MELLRPRDWEAESQSRTLTSRGLGNGIRWRAMIRISVDCSMYILTQLGFIPQWINGLLADCDWDDYSWPSEHDGDCKPILWSSREWSLGLERAYTNHHMKTHSQVIKLNKSSSLPSQYVLPY